MAHTYLSRWTIAQFIKGVSSRALQDEFPVLKKRYWGPHLWACGYLCGTVEAVTEEPIKTYIDHHLADSSEQNFSIEPDFQSRLQRLFNP